MAVIVGLAVVVTKELHRVVLDNVLREVLGEVLGSVPERGNGLNVFVQTESEAVLLFVVGHEFEGVVVDVAVQLNAGLDAPVPLVVEHQWVAEEKPRFVAAHVTVADGVAVDDLLLLHLLTDFGCLVLVNPLRVGPVLLGDASILGLAGNEGRCDPLELVVEIFVVEEDPVVVEFAVEAILDVANGLCNLPDVLVTGERDESGVHALSRHSRSRKFLVDWCDGWLGILHVVRGTGDDIGLAGDDFRLARDDFSAGSGAGAGGVLVAGPGRGRDGRGGADEVEEDKCLPESACAVGFQRECLTTTAKTM